jgi:cytochrome c nitrite reductase small subunit
MSASAGKAGLLLLIVLAVGAALGFLLAFGPPGLYAKSETPEFCGSCHVMESQYESWFHSGSHSRINCVDCHLPNDSLPRHLTWKALDGARDFLAFHLGRVSDPIKISTRGAGFVQENCLRCHSEAVARISTDRNCWECHRRFNHKLTSAIAAWMP